MLVIWKKSCDKPRQCIKKQRHYFADKSPYSQSYGFSSSHVWVWELNHKEGWVLKNWCFWIVLLEKILESPLDCKVIKTINSKENQSWIFIVRMDTENEVEAPILWPPDVKSQLITKDPDSGKDWMQKKKWMTEDEMAGWHCWFNGHEFEKAPGDGDGQGRLVCCSPWPQRVRHYWATELQQNFYRKLAFLPSFLPSLLPSFPPSFLPFFAEHFTEVKGKLPTKKFIFKRMKSS